MEDSAVEESKNGVLGDMEAVVSLVKTLAELFSSAGDIYRELKKRKHKDAAGRDKDEKHRHRKWLLGKRDSSSSSSLSSSSDSDSETDSPTPKKGKPKQRHKKEKEKEKESDESTDEESIKSSGAILQAKYEHGFGRLGRRYAVGDLLAQNQLQTQIIALQQTLMLVYQQQMLSPKERVTRILRTTRSVRTASTQALAGLYHRIATHEPMLGPGPRHVRRWLSSRHLYCPYALQLQDDIYQPLGSCFRKGGRARCPCCRHGIKCRVGRAWELIISDPCRRGRSRVFMIESRFLVKCHREGGGFACVLCSRFKDCDTTCAEIADLVDHVWREHEMRELEDEEDISEVP